jgi:hypothetical protein
MNDWMSFNAKLIGPTEGKIPESIAERGKRSCNKKTYGSCLKRSNNGPRKPIKGGLETISTLVNFFLDKRTQKKADARKMMPDNNLDDILDVAELMYENLVMPGRL